MKVYMKKIKVIAVFTEDGLITPFKFQLTDDNEELQTIKVEHICERRKEKHAGFHVLTYRCQSIIDGIEKIYELQYQVENCTWYLYKM